MKRSAGNLELIGGRLCLDFANTVSTRVEALRREYLHTYADLAAWSRHAGLLTGEEAAALLEEAAARPGTAAAVLERAIALREAIYGAFSAAADGQSPGPADLAVINHELRLAFSHLQIAPAETGFAWTWAAKGASLERMLWPVVRSAADLLTCEDLARVGKCARHGCDWLFVDLSKNRSRRWCSMQACGSRVKAGRYYRRRREDQDSPRAGPT
jgi:predicted RNA-binding Zn ribbon-like protein